MKQASVLRYLILIGLQVFSMYLKTSTSSKLNNAAKFSASCLALPALLLEPVICSADQIDQVYRSDNFAFKYSNDLVLTPKLVKTHDTEVFLKSDKYKGFNVGLTV